MMVEYICIEIYDFKIEYRKGVKYVNVDVLLCILICRCLCENCFDCLKKLSVWVNLIVIN